MDGIEIQEGSLTSIQSTNRKPKYFPFPDVHGRELSSAIMIQDCIGAGVATTMQSWSRYAACQQRVASCMWSCTTLTAQVCCLVSSVAGQLHSVSLILHGSACEQEFQYKASHHCSP